MRLTGDAIGWDNRIRWIRRFYGDIEGRDDNDVMMREEDVCRVMSNFYMLPFPLHLVIKVSKVKSLENFAFSFAFFSSRSQAPGVSLFLFPTQHHSKTEKPPSQQPETAE